MENIFFRNSSHRLYIFYCFFLSNNNAPSTIEILHVSDLKNVIPLSDFNSHNSHVELSGCGKYCYKI